MSGSGPHILVVEDDPAIRRGLCDALRFEGYTPCECSEGRSAAGRALDPEIRLVLLDVMLPGKDGFAVLAQIRQSRPTLPVVLVTARGSEEDRVRGLKLGGDDYVVKPFSAREVLARVAAVLRRSNERAGPVHRVCLGALALDLARLEITCTEGPPQPLTNNEAGIVRTLALHRDRTVTREELLRGVLGVDPRGVETRAIDMQIARLREKLRGDGPACELIETVRGTGYRLHPDAQVES